MKPIIALLACLLLPIAADPAIASEHNWPGGDAHEQIDAARAMGFDGLLYYGVDEPRTPEQIERCLREAKRRREQGLPMLTAINSRQSQEALGDVVSHPVYNLWVFDGPDNPAVLRAREDSKLPEERERQAVNQFLIAPRLARRHDVG